MAYTQEQKRSHIRELQTFLHGKSHTGDALHVIPDGFYGTKTEAAVQQFQQENQILPTGETDSDTWDALAAYYQAQVQKPVMQVSIFSTGFRRFVLHDTGTAVYLLQGVLQALHQLYGNLPPVDNCGVYDEKTMHAVQEFQKNTILHPDGEVDENTWNRMMSALTPQIGCCWD